MQSRERIYDELLNLTYLFDKPQEVKRLQLYTEKLMQYDFESTIKAMSEIGSTSKFFPALSEIIEKIKSPDASTDEQAVMIANEIVECFSKFGHTHEGEARAYLGLDKWGVVERSGGWQNICMATYAELGTMKAQIREVAKAYLLRSKRESTGGSLRINTNPVQIGSTKLERLEY